MEKEIRKSYVFRLKPTDPVTETFIKYADASRFMYNWGLAQIKQVWDQRKLELDPEKKKEYKIPSKFDFFYQLTDLRKQEQYLWLADIPLVILRASLTDLSMGMQHFFRRCKNKETPGFPRFKSRFYDHAFRIIGTKITYGKILIPKLGWVRFIQSREIVGIPKEATIKRDGKFWYVAISCVEKRTVVPSQGTRVSTLSLRYTHENTQPVIFKDNMHLFTVPQYVHDESARLAKLQQALATKTGEKNRLKVIEKINSIYRKIRYKRKDQLHKFSTDLVKNYDEIIVDDLPLKDMMKEKIFAKQLSEIGWANLIDMIKYKCDWNGKRIEKYKSNL